MFRRKVLVAQVRSLEMSFILAKSSYRLIEKASRRICHSDSQTLAPSLSYMKSLQLTTLYTLPHGLPRHAQSTHGFHYRHVVCWSSVYKQIA